MLRLVLAVAAASCLLASPKSKGAPVLMPSDEVFAPLPVVPVVVFGQGGRLTADEFARRNGLDAREIIRRHRASGLIQCGNARGAGQLTLADNVITTAAHVFFDERGKLRGDNAHCAFTLAIAGQISSTQIDVASIVTGGADPYTDSPVHDWAVARLARPAEGASPYWIGAPPQSGAAIEFAARGHADWGEASALSLQDCSLREMLAGGSDGAREFSFDCDAGPGASGGALLDASSQRLVAIFVGYRSRYPSEPAPFSPQHYNFAVTLEGAFRRAVETMAGAAATASAR